MDVDAFRGLHVLSLATEIVQPSGPAPPQVRPPPLPPRESSSLVGHMGGVSRGDGGSAGGEGGRARKSNRGRKQSRCGNCIKLKIQCTRIFPCLKCCELCIKCVPPPAVASKSYMELAISSLDPQNLNKQYLSALKRAHAKGDFDLERYKLTLRAWRDDSMQAGSDVTRGLYNQILNWLKLSPADLESDMQLELDARGPGATAEGLRQWKSELSRKIMQTAAFRALDDGESFLGVFVFVQGKQIYALNEAGGRLFASGVELDASVRNHRLLHFHIFASMVAYQDRGDFLNTYCADFSRRPQPSSSMLKFCGKDGEMDLFHFKRRFMRLPEFPEHTAEVLMLTRAPESKYVTKRPAHAHHIVHKFREGDKKPSVVRRPRQSQVVEDPNAPIRLPAMACIPLPPVPVEKMDEYSKDEELEGNTSVFSTIKLTYATGQDPQVATTAAGPPPLPPSPFWGHNGVSESLDGHPHPFHHGLTDKYTGQFYLSAPAPTHTPPQTSTHTQQQHTVDHLTSSIVKSTSSCHRLRHCIRSSPL